MVGVVSNAQFSVLYGDEKIVYERINSRSQARRVTIKVHPSCRVVVSAPAFATDDEVSHAIKKRARWIYKRLREFNERRVAVTPRRYVSGESHYYLGKQYLLKVVKCSETEQRVKLYRGRLEVNVRKKNGAEVCKLLTNWYKNKAKEIFAARLAALLSQTLWISDSPPLRVQMMKTQWGSCSPQGRLTLNLHLVKAPRECIDYVILHELCHLAEHNHSDKFYRLMGQVMPDWEKVKEKLDSRAGVLLNGLVK